MKGFELAQVKKRRCKEVEHVEIRGKEMKSLGAREEKLK